MTRLTSRLTTGLASRISSGHLCRCKVAHLLQLRGTHVRTLLLDDLEEVVSVASPLAGTGCIWSIGIAGPAGGEQLSVSAGIA